MDRGKDESKGQGKVLIAVFSRGRAKKMGEEVCIGDDGKQRQGG